MIRYVNTVVSNAEFSDMLSALQTYIKLAVDVRLSVLAGGGEMHADCEELLLEKGSLQEDIWGADWYPESKSVGFESFINIRPSQNNRSMELQDESLRAKLDAIVRTFLDAHINA